VILKAGLTALYMWMQIERALDRSINGLGRRLDRLLSSCDDTGKLRSSHPLSLQLGSRPGQNPRTLRGVYEATPGGSGQLNAMGSDCWCAGTDDGGDEDGGVEEQLQAHLEVYDVGQERGPETPETVNAATMLLLSKPQELAQKMFGIRTTYTLRRGPKTHVQHVGGEQTSGSAHQRGAHNHQLERTSRGINSEGSGCVNTSLRPLMKVHAQAAWTSRPVIPKLCLADMFPALCDTDETESQHILPLHTHEQLVSMRATHAHSDKYALPARRLSTSRPASARLTELARRPASARINHPRVIYAHVAPSEIPYSWSTSMDFHDLERTWARSHARVRSAKTRTGCHTISQGHILLPTDEHKLSWAKGPMQVSLGQVDTTTPLAMKLDFGSLRPALRKPGARNAASDAHKGPVNKLQGQLERESEQASDRKDREGEGGGGDAGRQQQGRKFGMTPALVQPRFQIMKSHVYRVKSCEIATNHAMKLPCCWTRTTIRILR